MPNIRTTKFSLKEYRNIALSYGVNLLTDDNVVLSHALHAFDRCKD